MSILAIFWLVVAGAIFALWTYLAYAVLFRLRRDAVTESGRMFPGLGATLKSFAGFLRRPDYARERRRMWWLTLLLFAVIGLRLVVLSNL
ncbi:hypothetical protein [Pseudooceanicola sp.]|uniref:hypothetical protein n=1 Tax=Pseudooceanicola sp. TaxID=1914328 RepID=UPI00262ECE0A|nr:hypothetical protein [Pseudooceanicola sp.]MDF1854420.1 hypothetical protein [Pseudooceanicola sp.]